MWETSYWTVRALQYWVPPATVGASPTNPDIQSIYSHGEDNFGNFYIVADSGIYLLINESYCNLTCAPNISKWSIDPSKLLDQLQETLPTVPQPSYVTTVATVPTSAPVATTTAPTAIQGSSNALQCFSSVTSVPASGSVWNVPICNICGTNQNRNYIPPTDPSKMNLKTLFLTILQHNWFCMKFKVSLEHMILIIQWQVVLVMSIFK